MARGEELRPEDLVFSGEEKAGGVDVVLQELLATDLTLEELERRLIHLALERCNGNVSKTARTLGLTRRTLQYRLEKARPASPAHDDGGSES